LDEPHHFNQAVFLESREPLDPTALEEALSALIAHHDALRTRIDLTVERPLPSLVEGGGPTPFRLVNLRDLGEAEQRETVKQVAEETQRSLDLADGPVIRAVYFDLGPAAPGRLLLVIHHLAVDGVSWRILLDDLWAAYEARHRGDAVSLPPRTTSIQRWATLLDEHARSPAVGAEQAYWLAEERSRAGKLPVDKPGGENLRRSSATVSLFLSREQTDALLRDVPEVYNTQINDVLLAAFALSFRAFLGGSAVLFELEGHGREDLFAGVDLTRTVGWFTTVFPVLLELEEETDPGRVLLSVKEQLRAVPGRGIGYGLLRYLRGDEALCRKLAALPQAEVSFNYLGQLGQAVPEAAPLKAAREPSGPTQSPRAKRAHLLEVSASVAAGRLQVSFTYGEELHERATITALAERYLDELRGLITHCLSPVAGGYSASDFRAGKLDQDTVLRLTSLAALPEDEAHPSAVSRKNVEDIYPLSPMQEGMLFHTLYAEGEGVYVAQLDWSVRGSFDTGAFERAFQRVVDRHGILRSLFVWEGLDQPLQVVCKQAKIQLDRHDLRGSSKETQSARLKRFAEEDRRRGFDLARAPLMRVTVFQLTDELHRCFFSSHHILLDGWSMSRLMRELLALYDAFAAGRDLDLGPTPPYGAFIAWLAEQNQTSAAIFYRKMLAGFRAPTAFGIDRSSFEGAEEGYDDQAIALSPASSESIVAFARDHQLTVNTLVQGAFAILLSGYSGEEDVLFGATVSGRSAPVPGIDRMMGLFINTVPARVRVAREQPLIAWLTALQAEQIEIREYEHAPLVAVQGFSDVPRGTPLFESNLVFENYPVEESMGPEPGKEAQRRATSMGDARVSERSNFPLMLVASITKKLSFRANYDRRRFEGSAIQRMLRHLETLVLGMVAAPSAKVGELPILPSVERETLLATWNDTAMVFPEDTCIPALIVAQAERRPDAPA
ncbi:MAG: condensation domain-containing protein, partial [Minicystis sp.]